MQEIKHGKTKKVPFCSLTIKKDCQKGGVYIQKEKSDAFLLQTKDLDITIFPVFNVSIDNFSI
jgi:hypothetical protein